MMQMGYAREGSVGAPVIAIEWGMLQNPAELLKQGVKDLLRLSDARMCGTCYGDDGLVRRKAAWAPPPRRYARNHGWMFSHHILRANEGCDLHFLETGHGATVPEPATL